MTEQKRPRPWDLDLIERQGPGTLVRVAKEGRLLRATGKSFSRVELNWIDETALALLEGAVAKQRSLTLGYPALAPEVGVLLAAQYLIHALTRRHINPSVGLVTADPGRAGQIWEELRVESQGDRVPLSEVFPYWRVSPEGGAPTKGILRGLIIGRRCAGWPVDLTIVDDLAGPVDVQTTGPVIHVAADPLEPEFNAGESALPTWGWSEATLGMYSPPPRPVASTARLPFSVAAGRVAVLAGGLSLTTHVSKHQVAERHLGEAREGLLRLSQLAGPSPSRHILVGLRVSWSHLATLTSLPCRPSEYDRFAGLPPRAARPSGQFEREVSAWARTLEPALRESAEDVAASLGLLRAALEEGNPMRAAIDGARLEEIEGHLIVRTRTAARAVCSAFGQTADDLRIGPLHVVWTSDLHKVAVLGRAVVVGAPPRSGWHRLASGLAPRIDMLVLGEPESQRAQRAWLALRSARASWSSQRVRGGVWKALFGEPLPSPYDEPVAPEAEMTAVTGPEFAADLDPFTPLGALLRDDRPLLAEEDISERLVDVVSERDYQAAVAAVEVHTDHGYVLIPRDREVDIILGDQLESEVATRLQKGARLILGREGGRLDLLAALEDRLGHRPDLLAAKMLVQEYQRRVYPAFQALLDSGLDPTDFYKRMHDRKCTKSDTAIRSWVTRGGPYGPRDYEDLYAINAVLKVGYTETRVRETDAGLKRFRVFRQHAGVAVTRAATAALLSREESRIDEELGLSIADLREAVTVVTVMSIRTLTRLVNVTEIGHLQEVPFEHS